MRRESKSLWANWIEYSFSISSPSWFYRPVETALPREGIPLPREGIQFNVHHSCSNFFLYA